MVLLRSFRCHRSNGIGLAKAFLTRGKNLWSNSYPDHRRRAELGGRRGSGYTRSDSRVRPFPKQPI